MFDIFSWQHIIILLVVALVVVGPKDLPRLMNMAGKWAGKARAMASEFRKSFDEMARQAELDELRKEIEELKKKNPVAEMQAELDAAQADISRSVDTAVDGAGQTPADSTAPVEGAIEPRSGEFEITDSGTQAVPETPAADIPAAMPDSKPVTSA
ncbi:MAG TPA: Sec-independent protein translocase protein TatB [Rhizomicrobium sp.]|nr:Sec-independent protein translocase protein TatB [Rhizomicrobium sp.]